MHREGRNGFLIEQNDSGLFPFSVSVIDGTWVDSFETLEDARSFCDEEQAEYYLQD